MKWLCMVMGHFIGPNSLLDALPPVDVVFSNDGKAWVWNHYVRGYSTQMNPAVFKRMQFTGLRDAKGVEIYEGDVVVYAQNNLPVAVIFSNGGFSVDLRGPNHSGESFLGTMLSQDIEVIGNVYENAELLK